MGRTVSLKKKKNCSVAAKYLISSCARNFEQRWSDKSVLRNAVQRFPLWSSFPSDCVLSILIDFLLRKSLQPEPISDSTVFIEVCVLAEDWGKNDIE